MSVYTITSGGRVPEAFEFRFCPKSQFHWRCDGDRCPVCGSKVEIARYELFATTAASGQGDA